MRLSVLKIPIHLHFYETYLPGQNVLSSKAHGVDKNTQATAIPSADLIQHIPFPVQFYIPFGDVNKNVVKMICNMFVKAMALANSMVRISSCKSPTNPLGTNATQRPQRRSSHCRVRPAKTRGAVILV